MQVFSNSTPRVASTPNRTKTNHHWLNPLQTLHTYNLRHLACGRSEGKLSNPCGNKRKSWTHFPSSFNQINTKNKKIKPYIHPVSMFCTVAPGTKRRTHILGRQGEHVTNSRIVAHKSWMARCFPHTLGF